MDRNTRLPEHFIEYEAEAVMSNFDGMVMEEVADAIKGAPEFSSYAGWDFNGKVWWEADSWHCEVWVYGSYMETVSASTLPEIMQDVSDKYGHA